MNKNVLLDNKDSMERGPESPLYWPDEFYWPPNLILGVAEPADAPSIYTAHYINMQALQRPNYIALVVPRGGDLAEKRDAQCQQGIYEYNCTHIFLMDMDMIYPPETLRDLLKIMHRTDADMVGGLCYRGYDPYDPLIWHPVEERPLIPFHDFQFGDVVESSKSGAACLLVKREVFLALEPPWFRFTEQLDDKNRWVRRGADVYFTKNATKAGFKLLVNTAYDIGHIREEVVDRNKWILGQILKQVEGIPGLLKIVENHFKQKGGKFMIRYD